MGTEQSLLSNREGDASHGVLMATFLLTMSTTVIRFRERYGSGVKKEEELFRYHCQGQSGSCSVIRGRAITAWAEMAGREDVTMGLGTGQWKR
jgi:hypothetical protein